MNRQEAEQLIRKYNRGLATDFERDLLENWYINEGMSQRLSEEEGDFLHLKEGIWAATIRRAGWSNQTNRLSKTRTWWPRYAAAAAILVFLSIGLYLYNQTDQRTLTDEVALDIQPGGNRATLTLADGRIVSLSDAQEGIVVDAETIKYTDGGLVTPGDGEGALSDLQIDATGEDAPILSLNTPRGGQYQVILSDGSKVWLNAASSLKYPSRFSGAERRVELSGEAYFEVVENKKQPFVVSSINQEVTVLGTEFSINAFPDEANIRTTLVEGSVQVATVLPASNFRSATDREASKRTIILKPGEQSIVFADGDVRSKTVNTYEFTGWRDNVFVFHNVNLKSIMRQICRWYDIEADIDKMPDREFYAEIPRNVSLSRVLRMLEETSDLKFQIVAEGTEKKERRIIIQQ